MNTKPDYDHEFTMGEDTEWDSLPDDIIATKENDEMVKIALLDQSPIQIVHAEKKAVREKNFTDVEEFRELVDWDVDWE